MAKNPEQKEKRPARGSVGVKRGGKISGAPPGSPGGAGRPSGSSKPGTSGKGKPDRKTAGKMGGNISGKPRKGGPGK